MNPYLRCFSGSAMAFFLLGAALNFALDPLGYFRNHGWHAGTFPGERVWADDRMAFDLSIDAYRPDTLIAGNSRVKHGFAMDGWQLPDRLGVTLKLGVRGAQFDELDRYIRRILDNNTVRNLMIGLDLGQFLRGRDPTVSSEQRSQLTSGGFLPDSAKKLVAALWSKHAFLASASFMAGPHTSTLDGGSNPEVLLQRLDGLGHRLRTRRIEARTARRHPILDSQIYAQRLTALDALLANACLKDTTVRLFVSPIHIRQLLLMREIGHLSLFFNWKAQLASIVGQHERRGCRVTLTDFSAISKYTSEPFPEPGDKQHRMRWYWESSHYNRRIGQMIVDRLSNDRDNHDGFGKHLTPRNITSWLDEERNNVNALVREQPMLVKEIRDLTR